MRHQFSTAVFVLAAMVYTIACLLDMYVLIAGLPKQQNTDNVVVMVLTAWNGLTLAVTGYFFGNSAGSDRKSELLAQSSPGPTVSVRGNDATVNAPPHDVVAEAVTGSSNRDR